MCVYLTNFVLCFSSRGWFRTLDQALLSPWPNGRTGHRLDAGELWSWCIWTRVSRFQLTRFRISTDGPCFNFGSSMIMINGRRPCSSYDTSYMLCPLLICLTSNIMSISLCKHEWSIDDRGSILLGWVAYPIPGISSLANTYFIPH